MWPTCLSPNPMWLVSVLGFWLLLGMTLLALLLSRVLLPPPPSHMTAFTCLLLSQGGKCIPSWMPLQYWDIYDSPETSLIFWELNTFPAVILEFLKCFTAKCIAGSSYLLAVVECLSSSTSQHKFLWLSFLSRPRLNPLEMISGCLNMS